MRKALRGLLLAALAAAVCAAQAGERRVALVIGNGAYRFNTTLRNPANDAADMAAALRRSGFTVASLLDAGRAEMEKAIRDFGTPLKSPEAVDFAFRSGGAPAAPPARAAATGAMTVEQAYGAIRVTVASDSRVYVDGADKGKPAAGGSGTISGVEAGSRTVEVRYADGRTERSAVTVEKERTVAASFAFSPAPPPAKVPDVFVLVEAGRFQMGSTSGDSDEKPVHAGTLSRAFYMSQYEVTQRQWREVMGSSPSCFKGDNLPVEQVSWYDAVEYCNRLSRREGRTPCYSGSGDNITCNFSADGYRLPTEAEWEYAARGDRSRGTTYAGSNSPGEVAWYDGNSANTTHPVGRRSRTSWASTI